MDPATVKQLDHLIGQGGDTADQACKQWRPISYSNSLIKQCLIVSALRATFKTSTRRNGTCLAIQNRLTRQTISCTLATTNVKTHPHTALHDLCNKNKQNHALCSHELQTKEKVHNKWNNKKSAKILQTIHKSKESQKTYWILDAQMPQSLIKVRLSEDSSILASSVYWSWGHVTTRRPKGL